MILVRRYRCRRCDGITTVLPLGLCARHYSVSAIGLLARTQSNYIPGDRARVHPE